MYGRVEPGKIASQYEPDTNLAWLFFSTDIFVCFRTPDVVERRWLESLVCGWVFKLSQVTTQLSGWWVVCSKPWEILSWYLVIVKTVDLQRGVSCYCESLSSVNGHKMLVLRLFLGLVQLHIRWFAMIISELTPAGFPHDSPMIWWWHLCNLTISPRSERNLNFGRYPVQSFRILVGFRGCAWYPRKACGVPW